MRTWLRVLLPTSFRDRYGDELMELLGESRHPLRDSVDLIFLAIRLNLENAMTGVFRWTGLGLILVGMFASGYATSDLGDGLAEMHRHWWSTAPVVGVLAGGLLLLASNRLRGRGARTTTAQG